MGGIINHLLNKFGSNIFWKKTNYVLTNKKSFLVHYMLFEAIESILGFLFSINNLFYLFARVWRCFLTLGNSRLKFEEYIDSKRKIKRGSLEPVPYRRYYSIFTRNILRKFGLFRKVTKKDKYKYKKLIAAPFFIPNELRFQDLDISIIGFRQHILNLEIIILQFPILLEYFSEEDWVFQIKKARIRKSMIRKKGSFGTIGSDVFFNGTFQIFNSYLDVIQKHCRKYRIIKSSYWIRSIQYISNIVNRNLSGERAGGR